MHTIGHLLHVPAVGLVPELDVLGEGEVGLAWYVIEIVAWLHTRDTNQYNNRVVIGREGGFEPSMVMRLSS